MQSFLGAHQAGDDTHELDGVNFWSDVDHFNLAAKNRQKLNHSMASSKPKQRAGLAAPVEVTHMFDASEKFKTVT